MKYHSIMAVAACLVLPLLFQTVGAQEASRLFGTLRFSDSWESVAPGGVYSFSIESPIKSSEVYVDSDSPFQQRDGDDAWEVGPNGGCVYHDGKYGILSWHVRADGSKVVWYHEYDASTWVRTAMLQLGDEFVCADLSYNPVDHQVYAICADADGEQSLAMVDFHARQRTDIAKLDTKMMAIAIDSRGTIYVLSEKRDLYRVGSGASLELLGSTGIPNTIAGLKSMTFDLATDRLYFPVAVDLWWDDFAEHNTYLYQLDTETGAATTIGVIDQGAGHQEWVGLYCPNEPATHEEPETAVPDVVTDLEAHLSPTDIHTVMLTFVCPSHATDGSPLDINPEETGYGSRIEVYRDGTLAHTFIGLAPGEPYEWEDHLPGADRQVTYRVVAYNRIGGSEPSEVSLYVGEDSPMPPLSARLTATGTTARLTWEPPTAGQHGGGIVASRLRYEVTDLSALTIPATGLTTNEWTCTLDDDGDQRLVAYGVSAYNEKGESDDRVSNSIIVGRPYTLPFVEHFGGDVPDNLWCTMPSDEESGTAKWIFYKGNAYFSGEHEGDRQWLSSGKISLQGSVHPTLQYRYAYKTNEGDRTFNVYIVANGRDTTLIAQHPSATASNGDAAIVRVKFSLEAYTDADYIQVVFEGHTGARHTHASVKELSIVDVPSYDLAVNMAYPSTYMTYCEPFQMNCSIMNQGVFTATGYDIQLIEDGQVIQTQAGQALEPEARRTYTFDVTPGTLKEELRYTVHIGWDIDQDLTNNTSEERKVSVVLPDFPTPRHLTATPTDGRLLLKWREPDYVGYAPATTEDVESLSPLPATDMGDWTSIDGDKLPTRTSLFPGSEEMTFEHLGEPLGFFVLDPEAAGLPLTDIPIGNDYFSWQPHSGRNIFVSVGGYWEVDNWLISPLLSGDAQSVHLYVRGSGEDYFEVRYSTTDRQPGSFQSIVHGSFAFHEWTLEEFDLPAGAKYFAIHHITNDLPYFMMVDDITYHPLSTKGTMTLVGYDVYRDGILIGSTTATELTVAADSEDHLYQVTAHYDAGTSVPASITANYEVLAVDEQCLTPSHATGFYTPDGMPLPRLRRGVNIVRTDDGKVMKILIP